MLRFTLVASILLASASAAQPRFIDIGDVPGGLTLGDADLVSADGTYVGGGGRPVDFTGDVFRWSEATGMEVLPRVPGGSFFQTRGMSPSGEFMVGQYSSPVTDGALSFVWSPSTGMTSVGPLPGQGSPTWLNDISDAGVAVGSSSVGQTGTGASLNRAVRWTASGGLEELPLPDPADADNQSAAFNILDDGRVFGQSASGRWLYSETQGFDIFPDEANLQLISDDGNILVGTQSFPGEPVEARAAYWTEHTGRVFLEPLVGGEVYTAGAMSGDGSVIVGVQGGRDFVIWIDQGTPMLFTDYVESMGVDLTGYSVSSVNAVSADGTTFVGQASRSTGGTIAYAIVIPAPGVLPVACTGLFALRRRR